MAKLMHAGQMILPLQDAQNLGVATAEELDLLERWMLYRIALARVNPTDHEADWPDAPV
ncbi:Caudovirales tail fiber assembly protein [compost metagenome]